jgi:hypothetical protein
MAHGRHGMGFVCQLRNFVGGNCPPQLLTRHEARTPKETGVQHGQRATVDIDTLVKEYYIERCIVPWSD